MATKKDKAAENLMEDPAALVTETAEAPKPGEGYSEKDREIAELKRQLAEAQKLNATIAKGNDFETVQLKYAEAIKEGKDPFGVKVSIRVPVRRDCNDRYYWGCVNGRSFQVPANNEYQEMPLPFAACLVDMIRAEKHAQYFADEEVKVYDPRSNPHEEEDIRH